MTATSATSTATSQLITSLGAGSGLNMAELANNLAVAQFAARTDRLTTRSDTLDRQISAASNLKNMMFSLASSLGDRVRVGDLSPQPALADSRIARVSLSGAAQPSGTYALEVTSLARSQTLASGVFASATTVIGGGTLTLRFGTVEPATTSPTSAPGSFAEDTAHAAAAITIAPGSTLEQVAQAITGAGAGVTAYVASGADGARLVIKGQEGASNGFVLESSDPDLAPLAWEPVAGSAARLSTGATNAAYKVDGVSLTSVSNTIANVVPGVNLTLTATNAGAPTQLSFSDPGAAITSAMQDLTAAFNEIMAELKTQTDPLTGDLARDSGARSLKQSFAALAGAVVMPNAAAGTPRTLADLGLSTQRDGTFVLDSKRLAATLKADPKGAAAMFTNGLYGVYATVDGVYRKATKASDPGTLAGSISRYTQQKTKVRDDLAEITDKQEALRLQMVRRFAATDNAVGASKSTLTFLQGQIDAWNAQRN